MECEVYVLSDGTYQCGNCGALTDRLPEECGQCGSKVVGIVDEGDGDGACEA